MASQFIMHVRHGMIMMGNMRTVSTPQPAGRICCAVHSCSRRQLSFFWSDNVGILFLSVVTARTENFAQAMRSLTGRIEEPVGPVTFWTVRKHAEESPRSDLSQEMTFSVSTRTWVAMQLHTIAYGCKPCVMDVKLGINRGLPMDTWLMIC